MFLKLLTLSLRTLMEDKLWNQRGPISNLRFPTHERYELGLTDMDPQCPFLWNEDNSTYYVG